MATVVEVARPDDPRVADYVALTDVSLRRRSEPAAGLFIAEGALVVARALRAGYALRSAFVAARTLAEVEPLLPPEAVAYVAAPEVMAAVAGFHVHRGVLAAFARKPLPSLAEVLAGARRAVVLEDTNNPTNLGAVFRSAAGLGVDAVLLSPECADPLYRRAVRVSMGEVFALPYARLDAWPDGLADVRAAGFRLLALTPRADAVRLDDLRLGADERAALLLGAEGPGLSAGALAAADLAVRIPMARGVDSLNLAAAAAVACYVLGRRPPEPGQD